MYDDATAVPSLDLIEPEIREGLPREIPRWTQAARELMYWDMRGVELIRPRPAETPGDFASRPKLTFQLVRRAVHELGKGLYCPGPSRELAGGGRELYDRVTAANSLNGMLQHGDRMAYLHGVFCIGVMPDASRGVRLDPWRADEFAVWMSDDDPRTPSAVCVRSHFPARRQLRYQAWTSREVRTYWSAVGDCDPTRTRSASLQLDPAMSEDHALGVLPFVFLHNESPVCSFWTPGYGRPLADANAALDQQLSDLAHSVQVFCIPERFAENLSNAGAMFHVPGGLIELTSRDKTREAKIFSAQPDLRVEEVWVHLLKYANQILSDLDLPLTVDPNERSYPESGVALVVRQRPLIQLWQARGESFKAYETALARTILAVAGKYGAAGVPGGPAELTVTFPEPQLPLPTPERDAADRWEIEMGLTSRIRLAMERYGLTRAQAVARLEQTSDDYAEERRIFGGNDSKEDVSDENLP
jgi:hypothetical protein